MYYLQKECRDFDGDFDDFENVDLKPYKGYGLQKVYITRLGKRRSGVKPFYNIVDLEKGDCASDIDFSSLDEAKTEIDKWLKEGLKGVENERS